MTSDESRPGVAAPAHVYAQPNLLDLPPVRKRCKACGRRLRDPESRRHGYGPVCWRKINPTPRHGRWVMVWIPLPTVRVGDDQMPLFEEEEGQSDGGVERRHRPLRTVARDRLDRPPQRRV